MQGASPLASPGLDGKRHWRRAGRWRYPGGGLTGWLPVYPAFSLLCRPYPPRPPSPPGKGGPKVYFARGFAPCIPGVGWEAAPEVGGKVVFDRRACPQNRARAPGCGNNNPFGKVLGVRGTLSRVPRRISAAMQERKKKAGTGRERRVTAIINSFGKVLGGSGDSFKSPPAYLRISPYPRPRLAKKKEPPTRGRFRGMITRRSDRSARCPAPGSSGRRHTG